MATEGFWDWDVKADRAYLSPCYCELLGYSPEDTVFDSHFFKLTIHPDDLSRVCDILEEYLQGTRTASCIEYRRFSKNGTVRWIEERGKAVEFDGQGAPVRLVGSVIDITKRKEIERKLHQSEVKFSTAFRSSPDSININRLNDGMYLEINEGFTAITGYTPEDVNGKTSLELDIWVDPHDRTRLVNELKEKGVVNNLEAQFRRKEGSILTGFMSARIIEIEGESCLLSITRDISERKRVEDELRREKALLRCIIDSVSDLIFVKDTQGVYQVFNKASEECIGLQECQQIGKTDFDFFSRDVAEVVREHDRQIMDSNKVRYMEEWVTYLDGRLRLLDTVKTPFHGPDGKLLGLVGISHDITERKQIEEDLRKKNTEIEQFIYSVSHDLRSPLVTVKAFLGYLESDMAGGNRERVAQDLQFMHSAADKMKLQLDELLEMFRIDRVETPPVSVSLKEIVTEALDTLAGSISEHKVSFRLPDMDLKLFGDRQSLCRIWQNLIENALKYRRDDSIPRIELGVQQTNGEAVFFIKDNGIGIEPHYHGKIFGIFEKLNPKSPGAGLGLSMIQRIVDKYGGRVWVESEGSGKGACFFFTLPHAMVQS